MKREDLILTNEAKKALESGDFLDIGSSDGFWYDLTKGGCLDVEDLIANKEQIAKFKKAIRIVELLEEVFDDVSYPV